MIMISRTIYQLAFLCATSLALSAQAVPQGIITTVAGGTGLSFRGSEPALEAEFGDASGIVVDRLGNIFVSLPNDHLVLRVDADGEAMVLAGNGFAGFSGDGGLATRASLRSPKGLALGHDGSLFIADSLNDRVRRLDPEGIISTVAGNGSRGYLGDGAPAIAAMLSSPEDVAVGPAGRLYVADRLNHRIRRVDLDGTIQTVAGNGTPDFSGDAGQALEASLNHPIAIDLAPDGSMLIADYENHRIRNVDTDGVISTVAGNGTAGYSGDGSQAIAASLNFPYDVFSSPNGEILVADFGNARIRRVTPDGRIATVAGSGSKGFTGDGGLATGASLRDPRRIGVYVAGSIHLTDSGNHRVRRFAIGGDITTVAGNGDSGVLGDGGLAASASLSQPWGLAVTPTGGVLIADRGNHRVRLVSTQGFISTVAGDGRDQISENGSPVSGSSVVAPTGVAIDQAGNIFIAEPSVVLHK